LSLFLASSIELKADREAFEILINRKNKDWHARGVFLELVVWEDFLDAVSPTRKQDEYDAAIRGCDLFVLMVATKVGHYTKVEFDTAIGQFQTTRRPFVFTYFKDVPATEPSVAALKARLDALGHFHTRYANTDALLGHFSRQLDKLAASGFVRFEPERPAPPSVTVGAAGVHVGGANHGSIVTAPQTNIHTGGGAYIGGSVQVNGGHFIGRDWVQAGATASDLAALLAPLQAALAAHAPPAAQPELQAQVAKLQASLATHSHGQPVDDGALARIVKGLADKVPEAAAALVALFAKPVLEGVAGPVTKFALEWLKGR
jgi:hypothetical protein